MVGVTASNQVPVEAETPPIKDQAVAQIPVATPNKVSSKPANRSKAMGEKFHKMYLRQIRRQLPVNKVNMMRGTTRVSFIVEVSAP
jgi:hypothetical protein